MRPLRISDPNHVTLMIGPTWSHCEDLIKAFEEAWRRGDAPRIADYLLADGPQRWPLLVELAHIDLEFRLKAGEPARVETYLGACPELATDRGVTLDLIAAEYELRRRHQPGVGLDEYRRRFPDYLPDLLQRFPHAEKDPTTPTGWPAVAGYEIIAELGRGGMGVVCKARDANLGRYVALKFLPAEFARDPDLLDRFRREARTASGLNHPHICTVHALGEHEGRPFIVMEFIEGRTLQALIPRLPTVEEVAWLIGQAARALTVAHAAGVVHRDVKPENIMVRGDGYVKVLDFGLARRLPTLAQPNPADGRDTDPGAMLGTVAYMSPEQARGIPVDCPSDVFSLGIVLYQLATGQHPFEADSALSRMHAIATRQPVSPSRLNPEIPPALEGLIESMLHKDPRRRPTASEVETALAALTGGARRAVPAPAPRLLVHREPELAALRASLHEANAGRGVLVCLAGEPGIGKTTLVEDFLAELAVTGPGCLVARGHCSERLDGTEAYLPVIDALGNLLREAPSGAVARLMKTVAPSWYAQVSPGAAEASRASSQPAMLREFRDLLQEVMSLGPVVLFFDDVHWADASTVDLLAHLGDRFHGLRVLAIVTYRPTELLLGPHPFHSVKRDLVGRGVCREVLVGFLGRDDVDCYLDLTFPGHGFPADFAALIHSRTEGSPLFIADLLRYLRECGVIAEETGRWTLARELPDLRQELPASIRGMILRKIDQVGEDDRRLLAAASVQGQEFDSAVVAAALGRPPAEIEARFQSLDRVYGLVRLLREHAFPDGTRSLRYRFVHVLYQHALHAGLSPTRRATLGAALARALHSHHGDDSPGVAAELASLYEVGRDFERAARQFHRAALGAASIFAHREAVVLARRGLRLLESLPTTPERAALELPLQTTLGMQLQVTEGFAAPDARRAYTRARELWQVLPDPAPLFPVLWGLWLHAKVRSELSRAQEMADELLELARRLNDPDLALQAHQALGVTALCRGEPTTALRHVEQASALYDPHRHRTHATLFGQDPGIICTAFGAVALWLLGYPDQAARQSDTALRLSWQLSPSSQTVALHFAAMLHQLRRDARRVRELTEVSVAIAADHGFSFWRAGGTAIGGWALAACGAADEGIERLRRGLHDWQASGSVTYLTYYLGLLAESLAERGQIEASRRVLEEALTLAHQTGERLYEAELYRLRGETLLRGGDVPGAEADFRRALAVARQQEAKSLELRAVISLYRCNPEARERLAETYGRFTEGFQTPDLKEARGLLENVN